MLATTRRTLPTSSLTGLLAELRELPGWPNVEINAALLMAETLRALGWPNAMIAATVDVDLLAVEAGAVEATGRG